MALNNRFGYRMSDNEVTGLPTQGLDGTGVRATTWSTTCPVPRDSSIIAKSCYVCHDALISEKEKYFLLLDGA